MNEVQRQRVREIQTAIQHVLYRDWDPLGVCDAGPKDEYDSYSGVVYRLLESQPTREEVLRTLKQLEDDSIGVSGSESARGFAADKLLTLAKSIREHFER